MLFGHDMIQHRDILNAPAKEILYLIAWAVDTFSCNNTNSWYIALDENKLKNRSFIVELHKQHLTKISIRKCSCIVLQYISGIMIVQYIDTYCTSLLHITIAKCFNNVILYI